MPAMRAMGANSLDQTVIPSLLCRFTNSLIRSPIQEGLRTRDKLKLKGSSVIHRFAWRSVFHPGVSGVKKLPACEQWLNSEGGSRDNSA
jgi:hypothetical protein